MSSGPMVNLDHVLIPLAVGGLTIACLVVGAFLSMAIVYSIRTIANVVNGQAENHRQERAVWKKDLTETHDRNTRTIERALDTLSDSIRAETAAQVAIRAGGANVSVNNNMDENSGKIEHKIEQAHDDRNQQQRSREQR